MIKLFKTNWTRYIPLGFTRFGDGQQLVLVKGNTRTGVLRFKSITVNPMATWTQSTGPLPLGSIKLDIAAQWELINKILNDGRETDNKADTRRVFQAARNEDLLGEGRA